MDLVVIGINHKTAPLEIREKFSFNPKEVAEVNRQLKETACLSENLVLSTCNRVELYAVAEDHKDYVRKLEDFLSRYHHLDISDYRVRFYVYRNKEAVEHLFKVACGLDSMVIGEIEILNQMKRAFQEAQASSATGKILNRLFEKAFNTAKRVRTETFISRGAVSVSSVAVKLAKKILGGLGDKKVLIIGAGKVGEKLVLNLKKEGIAEMLVTNRTWEKARDLAQRFSAQIVAFENFKASLPEVDIIITSTGSPQYVIWKKEILALMPLRKLKPLFIIDLAVPRDVEAQINQLDNVYLYNIDDLQKTVDETISLRSNELERCFKVIERSAQHFLGWLGEERLRDEEEVSIGLPEEQVSPCAGKIS